MHRSFALLRMKQVNYGGEMQSALTSKGAIGLFCDYSAGYTVAGVSCGIGLLIVGLGVDD